MAKMRGKRVYTGRHVNVNFELDRKGIAKCAVGPDLRDACHDIIVNRALPYALSIAPRSSNNEPGHQHYADHFEVDDTTTGLPPEAITARWPMLRVASRLVNQVRHAVFVEFGGQHENGHQVMTRTLEHLNRT